METDIEAELAAERVLIFQETAKAQQLEQEAKAGRTANKEKTRLPRPTQTQKALPRPHSSKPPLTLTKNILEVSMITK